MQSNNTMRAKAMTLIEVLIALTVASLVFSSLLQMTFDSLKRAKNLELQDKMRNYATDIVQVIYNSKDTDWVNTFGENAVIPPAVKDAPITQQPYGYIDVSNPTEKAKLVALRYDDCHFDETLGVLTGPNCEMTAANETETATNKKFFGRIIVRSDNDQKDSIAERDTTSDAQIEVIVACIESKCDGKILKPFKLSFQIYRTSAP